MFGKLHSSNKKSRNKKIAEEEKQQKKYLIDRESLQLSLYQASLSSISSIKKKMWMQRLYQNSNSQNSKKKNKIP